MYITRNKGVNGDPGKLCLWRKFPCRHIYYDIWTLDPGNASKEAFPENICWEIDSRLFPELKWEDEPVEAELILKKDAKQ